MVINSDYLSLSHGRPLHHRPSIPFKSHLLRFERRRSLKVLFLGTRRLDSRIRPLLCMFLDGATSSSSIRKCFLWSRRLHSSKYRVASVEGPIDIRSRTIWRPSSPGHPSESLRGENFFIPRGEYRCCAFGAHAEEKHAVTATVINVSESNVSFY